MQHDFESQALVGSPSIRRNLYDGPNSTLNDVDLSTELLSVREETINLSSRAMIEGISSGDESSREPSPESSPILPQERTPLLEPVVSAGSLREKAPSALDEIKSDLSVGRIIHYLPSVLVGTLLNVLDGLSYGMILFPVAAPMFAGLEAAGLSMFYVSTFISQLVYAFGASGFKSAVGSEMIEIVPFFHSIGLTIASSLADRPRDEILATTITAYALSSIVTGLVFLLCGYLRLGTIAAFFPRHILVGCIGGVGFFLVATAVEVSARLSGGIHYNLATLKELLELDVAARWGTCVLLAAFLCIMERKYHHPLMIPGILGSAFVLVYIIIFAIPRFSLDEARDAGWLFPAQGSGEPWYGFYSMYKFNKVHWLNLVETIPAMFALTFFGLIHVPINVPALVAATKNDNINVNQELFAHGISNTLSGMLGSIQNYVVYTNSVMFIRSGGDSRMSNVLLAIATAGVAIIGPASIGYIPVMVVASLMFMMGFDLLSEALIDTIGKVDHLEYLTIFVIVVTMGMYDFVVGILVGIILACLSFILSSARTSCIRSTFTGSTARSTVNRSLPLQRFLSRVGSQIYIIKLQGPLFFGTNVQFENECRKVIESKNRSTRYLIIDLYWVTYIDFCSADTFQLIKRLSDANGVQMILSGASKFGSVVRGLRAVDLISEGDGPGSTRLFPTLNSTLEYCENMFLSQYYSHRDRLHATKEITAPRVSRQRLSSGGTSPFGTTPRANNIRMAAMSSVAEENQTQAKWAKLTQPMPLLMTVVEGIDGSIDQDTCFKLSKFFTPKTCVAGEPAMIVDKNSCGFCLVESGQLRTEFPAFNNLHETMLAGTAFGTPVGTHSIPYRMVAETDAKIWIISEENYRLLQKVDTQAACKLLELAMNVQGTRLQTLLSYLYVCSV